jgi:hypothetical protein
VLLRAYSSRSDTAASDLAALRAGPAQAATAIAASRPAAAPKVIGSSGVRGDPSQLPTRRMPGLVWSEAVLLLFLTREVQMDDLTGKVVFERMPSVPYAKPRPDRHFASFSPSAGC